MRLIHIVLLIVLAALVGFSIFGVLVWRSVETETVEPEPAVLRFQEIRARYPDRAPMLDLDGEGKLTARSSPADVDPAPVKTLRVLVYRAREGKLIAAEAPFWFVKLKGPAAAFAFRGTGFDLEELGVTPGDLERNGPGIILDETDNRGDRLLVWIE